MESVEHLDTDVWEHLAIALIVLLGWVVREGIGLYQRRASHDEGGRLVERLSKLEAHTEAISSLLDRQQKELDERPPKWLTEQVREVRQDVQALSQHVHQLRRRDAEDA